MATLLALLDVIFPLKRHCLEEASLCATDLCAKKSNGTFFLRKRIDMVSVFINLMWKHCWCFLMLSVQTKRELKVGRTYCLSELAFERMAGFAHWKSRKNSCVCISTRSVDNLTVGDALDFSIWLQQLWFEIFGKKIEIEIVSDIKGTSSNSTTTRLPIERRNRNDMAFLFQAMRRREFGQTWVPLTNEMEKGKTHN